MWAHCNHFFVRAVKGHTRLNNKLMKTTKFYLVILCIIISGIALAQGSGKVMLKADISTADTKEDVQISVIDLASKAILQKEEVATRFFADIPLNGRYMIYFKKVGHPSARLIVDTNVEAYANYHVHLKLNLSHTNEALETGLSTSLGILNFDKSLASFQLQASSVNASNMAQITYSGTSSSEAVKF